MIIRLQASGCRPHGSSFRPQASGRRVQNKFPLQLAACSMQLDRLAACSLKPEQGTIDFRNIRRNGFTLVELLVTTSLMALVGGAMVAALAGGMSVWERASQMGTGQQASLIAFEWMRRDLSNARRFHPVPFEGAYDRYTFAAAERAAVDVPMPQEIGRLGYFLDERRHVLCRSFVPYRLMRGERLTDRCQAVLEDVARVRFGYFGTQEKGGEPEWSGHWDVEGEPLAVKLELVVQSGRQPPATHTMVIARPNEPPEPPTEK